LDERGLRELIGAVQARRVSRRDFVRRMVGFGLTAPMARQLLAHAGPAQAPVGAAYKPVRAGGGGALRVLFWQAATLLNPHFATGSKDQEGARIFYETLTAWDPDGNLVPVLAAEIPDIENGGIAADGMSVTWKLKQGVKWHDGEPFTAEDVVFNWEYATDPETGPRRSAAIRTPPSSKRSIRSPCGFTSRSRRRSGRDAPTA
jgi:peptide/nickel transport system substrate-binding protein